MKTHAGFVNIVLVDLQNFFSSFPSILTGPFPLCASDFLSAWYFIAAEVINRGVTYQYLKTDTI